MVNSVNHNVFYQGVLVVDAQVHLNAVTLHIKELQSTHDVSTEASTRTTLTKIAKITVSERAVAKFHSRFTHNLLREYSRCRASVLNVEVLNQ